MTTSVHRRIGNIALIADQIPHSLLNRKRPVTVENFQSQALLNEIRLHCGQCLSGVPMEENLRAGIKPLMREIRLRRVSDLQFRWARERFHIHQMMGRGFGSTAAHETRAEKSREQSSHRLEQVIHLFSAFEFRRLNQRRRESLQSGTIRTSLASMSTSPKLISANDLETRCRANTGPMVLDVRLAEDHACDRIPGAVNNCVFEVAFGERLLTLAPNKNLPLCIYGANEGSREAAVACEKLSRAGYTQILRLGGGISAWKEAGFPTEGTHETVDAPGIPAGRRALDLGESRVEWIGRNLLNKHWGSIALKSGYLDFDGATITGGEIVISMHEIHCDDLAGTSLHDVLVAHLRSDDFFDTERFPEARVVLRSVRFDPNATPGGQNLNMEADLTLKGVTAPVSFTASAGLDTDGRPAAQASFAIDRTQWGVLYGSGKFFHRLAGHLVNDLIEIQLRIVAMA